MEETDLAERETSVRRGIAPPFLQFRRNGRAIEGERLASAERHSVNAREDLFAAKEI
jgi:hypothetical protein